MIRGGDGEHWGRRHCWRPPTTASGSGGSPSARCRPARCSGCRLVNLSGDGQADLSVHGGRTRRSTPTRPSTCRHWEADLGEGPRRAPFGENVDRRRPRGRRQHRRPVALGRGRARGLPAPAGRASNSPLPPAAGPTSRADALERPDRLGTCVGRARRGDGRSTLEVVETDPRTVGARRPEAMGDRPSSAGTSSPRSPTLPAPRPEWRPPSGAPRPPRRLISRRRCRRDGGELVGLAAELVLGSWPRGSSGDRVVRSMLMPPWTWRPGVADDVRRPGRPVPSDGHRLGGLGRLLVEHRRRRQRGQPHPVEGDVGVGWVAGFRRPWKLPGWGGRTGGAGRVLGGDLARLVARP